MFDLEKSILEWRKQMLAVGIKTPVPLEELENHLREEIEKQILSGQNERSALEIARGKIGQVGILNDEFKQAEGMREMTQSVVKSFFKVALLALPLIVLIMNVCLVNGWHGPRLVWMYAPARVISPVAGENAPMSQVPGHPSYSSVPSTDSLLALYDRFAGRSSVPWWFPSFCITEVLLFSLVLAFAAYFQTPKSGENIRRQRRIFWIGQLFLGFCAAYGVFPPNPFFALVMAVIICTIFVLALRWQRPAAVMSS